MNANFIDIATALSSVLTRDNQAPMTAPLRLADGSAPLPGLQFADDTNTGLRRSGTDEMRWVGGGIDRMFIDAVGKMWALGALDVAGAANFQAALAAAGQVTVSNATFPPLQVERTTALTAALQSAMRLLTTSSGDMANGFATGLGFAIRDAAVVINDIATISAVRAGADNTGELLVSTFVAGVSGERARFSADGLSLAAALTLPAGFVDLNEIAAPANPAADVARLYAKDDGGVPILAYLNSAGAEAEILNSVVIQAVYAEVATVVTINVAIPDDDTIPQQTEGVEIITSTITLKKSTNRVRVRANIPFTVAPDVTIIIGALFLGAGANAIYATWRRFTSTADDEVFSGPMVMDFEHAPGSVGPLTYKVRLGGTGTAFVNGNSVGVRNYGGVSKAVLTLEEVHV